MERVKQPLIHITKRDPMPLWKGLCIRFGAVLIALVISAIFISASAPRQRGFFAFFGSLFSGAFGTEWRFWLLLQNTALLLCVALALVVAFKMKFWNLGGNGQVLIGCLACAMCMYYLGGEWSDPLVCLLMFVASVAAGAVWAVIPAVFKAFFNTNESLFTLMMNYIAMYLVAYFIAVWYPNGTGAMPTLGDANLPTFGSGQAGRTLPIVLAAVIVTAFVFCYLRFSKHGFEVSLVGESRNTARYAGINVKKVIIRTLALSGAMCGLVGFLLVGSVNHMVSTSMDGNMGFTGIMVAWMGKFDPLIMAGVALFINFLTRGMAQVNTDFGYTNSALSDIVVGLIYFFFIGCEFFIVYKVHFNFRKTTARSAPEFSTDDRPQGAGEQHIHEEESSPPVREQTAATVTQDVLQDGPIGPDGSAPSEMAQQAVSTRKRKGKKEEN